MNQEIKDSIVGINMEIKKACENIESYTVNDSQMQDYQNMKQQESLMKKAKPKQKRFKSVPMNKENPGRIYDICNRKKTRPKSSVTKVTKE